MTTAADAALAARVREVISAHALLGSCVDLEVQNGRVRLIVR